MAVFRFSQPMYNVDESSGEACVCLGLVSGELDIDVVIEVSNDENNIMFNSGCKLILQN